MAVVHGRASEKAQAASVKAKRLSKIKLKEEDILLIVCIKQWKGRGYVNFAFEWASYID